MRRLYFNLGIDRGMYVYAVTNLIYNSIIRVSSGHTASSRLEQEIDDFKLRDENREHIST